jgi:DNA-directed RNA polymerase subunit L
MEGRIMTFKSSYDMYDANNANIKDLNNKLFCTFTSGEELDELVSELSTVYTIMYNKMFVLFVKSTNEYVITYNVDQGNINSIPENTILVHRKKETNTLYTINALNELIKKLNDGVVDMAYRVNWPHYRNSILLTQHNELKQLNTKVFKIIEL